MTRATAPLPTDLGQEAYEFLQAHGLNAVNPPIRSSDYELYMKNPLVYLLRVRLGLTPAASNEASRALKEGSWFHTILEHDVTTASELSELIAERKEELKGIGELQGRSTDWIERDIQEMGRDAKTALAWYRSALTVPLVGGDTSEKKLKAYKLVGREVLLEGRNMLASKSGRQGHANIRLDALYLDPKENTLWIFDAKTTSETVPVRIATCAHEFQTLLYLDVLRLNLEAGVLHQMFPTLPPSVRVGGMIHWVVQKPTIRMGRDDRDFKLVEKTISRGPRKGAVDVQKEYEGEPKFENYLRRVKDWYHATGDYLHEAPFREETPVVGFSFTNFRHVELENNDWYQKMLTTAHTAATIPPYPANFPPSTTDMRLFGRLSPYFPFMIAPVFRWPEIVANEGFTISHRI